MKRLGCIFFVLVGFALAAALTGILLASAGHRLGGPTVLVWRIDRPILEQAPEALPWSGDAADSLSVLYPALRAARADREVRGIAVYLQAAEMGLAKAQEIRRQLTALRAAGKFAECYLEAAGDGANGTLAYYLASACDRIELAPSGDLALLGLYTDGTFLKGGLDKLKVDPQFHHVGAYKSYAETYTETRWTPPAAEAVNAVLDSCYGQIVDAIAAARKLPATRVRELIDGAPYAAPEAVEKGFVDKLGYPDEFRARVARRAGGTPRFLRLQDYAGRRSGGLGSLGSRRIAVVVAQGGIVRGGSGSAPWSSEAGVGSDDMALLLRRLAREEGIAAVILRVDSPGGSALASDLILHEVQLLARKKPVIVSMSDVAASGGYYIAARASKIVAEPATLTGSIGVVGGKFVTRRLQEEILGITHEPLKRGRNADLYSTLNAFTPEQDARVQAMMEGVYRTFVGHVAAGRRMSRAAVEAVAGGRVWTGADAKRLGLVDELGGLDRAIELALRSAGLPPQEAVELDYYPDRRGFFDLFRSRRAPLLPAALAELAKDFETHGGTLELPPELARLSHPF
jgi:protease IV